MTASESLTQELRRLIEQHGMEAVREEAKRLCKGRRGRPAEPDFWRYKDEIENDARTWLAGGDPIAARSSHAIAKKVAEQHSSPTTQTASALSRTRRNLKPIRLNLIKMKALLICESERPYSDYFRVADEVLSIKDYSAAVSLLVWIRNLELARYRERFGDPPDNFTIKQIAEHAASASNIVDETPKNVLAELLGLSGDENRPD